MDTFLAKGVDGSWSKGTNPLQASGSLGCKTVELFYFDPKRVTNSWVNADGTVGVEWLASLRGDDHAKQRKVWSNEFWLGFFQKDEVGLTPKEGVDTKRTCVTL